MPVTAVRDEGALRMWVCRLPVHIDPRKAANLPKMSVRDGLICRDDVGIVPYMAGAVFAMLRKTRLSFNVKTPPRALPAAAFLSIFLKYTLC